MHTAQYSSTVCFFCFFRAVSVTGTSCWCQETALTGPRARRDEARAAGGAYSQQMFALSFLLFLGFRERRCCHSDRDQGQRLLSKMRHTRCARLAYMQKSDKEIETLPQVDNIEKKVTFSLSYPVPQTRMISGYGAKCIPR